MEITLRPTSFADIEAPVRAHLAGFQSPTDSFYENHVLRSSHCQIVVEGSCGGFASIHQETLVTQFALEPDYRHLGQRAFFELRRTASVQAAFVPTSDEFFLTHALDEYRSLAKQAYFFTVAEERIQSPPSGYRLQIATPKDAVIIHEETDDFLEPVEASIAKGHVFLAYRDNELVGFGIMEVSMLREATASIGMFTRKSMRGQGVATGIVALMIEEARKRDLTPVAGCWCANHASKRTLERAGMYSPTRLLRVEY